MLKEIISFSDCYDRPAELTADQLEWFRNTVKKCLDASGYDVPVIAYDHDLYKGKSRDALGCCCTGDPENPLRKEAGTFITIDCYFIDEQWNAMHGTGWNISGDTLEGVIAHELAHLTVWRHGRKHKRRTAEILEAIKAA